jgi:hypothetical protein
MSNEKLLYSLKRIHGILCEQIIPTALVDILLNYAVYKRNMSFFQVVRKFY